MNQQDKSPIISNSSKASKNSGQVVKIFIASDHAGFVLKEKILEHFRNSIHELDFIDLGTNSESSVDYPDYAKKLALQIDCEEKLARFSADSHISSFGILICATGIGMSISANRFSSVRAALCHNEFTAEMSRRHNNANVLVLGAKIVSKIEACKIINVFLNQQFEAGRHLTRIQKFDANFS